MLLTVQIFDNYTCHVRYPPTIVTKNLIRLAKGFFIPSSSLVTLTNVLTRV